MFDVGNGDYKFKVARGVGSAEECARACWRDADCAGVDFDGVMSRCFVVFLYVMQESPLFSKTGAECSPTRAACPPRLT